jgi:hypothetical protein
MPRYEILGVIGSNYLGELRSQKPDVWPGGMLIFMESGAVYRGLGSWRKPSGERVKNKSVGKIPVPVTGSKILGFLNEHGAELNKVYLHYPLSDELGRLFEARENAIIQGIRAQVERDEGGEHLLE